MKRDIPKLDAKPRKGAKPVRHVVAALILRGGPDAQQVLVCQRRPDQPMGSKWEFPGGKVENGETAEVALARELNEELGIDATVGVRLTTVRHNYRNGSTIEIQFFRVDAFSGEIQNLIFQDMRWTSFASLPGFDFLAADVTFVRDLAAGKLL